MKNLLNFRNASFLALIFIAFVSCKKNEDATPDLRTEADIVADNTESEEDFDNAFAYSDQALRSFENDLNSPPLAKAPKPCNWYNPTGCATINITNFMVDNAAGRRVTLNFGTSGCVGPDGKSRKGKIIITFIHPSNQGGNPFNVVGRRVTTTFDGYFVDGIKVEGTKIVTRLAAEVGDGDFILRHRIQVSNAKITYPDGKFVSWNSDRTRRVDLQNTPLNPTDDIAAVWGTYSGTNKNGVNYTAAVVKEQALTYKAECFYPPAPMGIKLPVRGVLTITNTSASPNKTAVFDFGNGNCDKTFTVTVNGQTYTING